MRITNPMQNLSESYDPFSQCVQVARHHINLSSTPLVPTSHLTTTFRVSHSFCNDFIAFAIAKLDFAITCRLSFVTSGSECTSLSLFACSPNSRRMSLPC